MAKKNGTPGQLDNNASDLLNFIYEFSDKPEVLSLIDDLVNKLKKITNREAFYEVCEFSPKLSSTLESLIKVKEHEDAITRKKDEKRGKYTIEKKYAHAFKEYSDYIAPRINEAVRAIAVQDLEALKALEGELIIYGSETNFKSNSVKKTKQRHRQLTQLKAALAALYVLNERQQQIMKLKLALQAVLELRKDSKQTQNQEQSAEQFLQDTLALVSSISSEMPENPSSNENYEENLTTLPDGATYDLTKALNDTMPSAYPKQKTYHI